MEDLIMKVATLLLIITLLAGAIAPHNQTGIIRATFSEPIIINRIQRDMLRQAAEKVDQEIKGLSKELINEREPFSSTDKDKETLIRHIDQRTRAIRVTQADFEVASDTQQVRAASRIFFGDIESYYETAR